MIPEKHIRNAFENETNGQNKHFFFSMAALQDIMVEGVTTFTSPPATSYRYVIELKSDKLSIWMEDRITKKQWYKGDMAKADYISSANAIPDASAADYVQCFQDSLDGDINDSSDVQRSLGALSGGGLRLKLAVTIRVLRSTWVAKYSFDLDPVSVERIDVLESKLRDQQEELEKLRGRCTQSPPYINLTATEMANKSMVCWSAVKSDEFVSTGVDGVVKVLRDGVYSIKATVTMNTGSHGSVQLLRDGKLIQAVYPGYLSGYNSSVHVSVVEYLKKHIALTVSTTSAIVDTSYLTIVRLGD